MLAHLKNHKNLLLHEGWLPIPFFLNRPHQRKQKGRGEEGGGSKIMVGPSETNFKCSINVKDIELQREATNCSLSKTLKNNKISTLIWRTTLN